MDQGFLILMQPSIHRYRQYDELTVPVKEAGLELEGAETISTPGVKQYPLTIECRVLYAQDQDLSRIPEDIREKMYPHDVDGTYPMANRDFHTMYVGEIVDAYIIR